MGLLGGAGILAGLSVVERVAKDVLVDGARSSNTGQRLDARHGHGLGVDEQSSGRNVAGGALNAQFAHPRARMLPGFAAAHLLVAGAIVVAAIAVQSVCASAWATPGIQPATVGPGLVAVAAGAWMACSLNAAKVFSLLGISLCVSLFLSRPLGEIARAISDNRVVAAGLGCVGLAALAALGARLAGLHGADAVRQAPILARWRDYQFRLFFGERTTRRRGPLLLRQLAGGFSALTVTLIVAPMLFVVPLWQTATGVELHRGDYIFWLSLLPMLIVLGGFLCVLWSTVPLLATESLRPTGRREFIRNLFRSSACDLAAPAMAHCAVATVYWTLMPPQRSPFGLLPAWLILTAATYAFSYGTLLWLASFRRLFVVMLGSWVICGLSALFIHTVMFVESDLRSPLSLTLVVVGAGVAAVVMYGVAFRRWCRVDLG